MSDKYIAEKLGLCWHEINAYHSGRHCSCGIRVCSFTSGPHPCEGKNPIFSQSVPLLKSEAKRAGLWWHFMQYIHDKYCGVSMYLTEFEEASEDLTDPALCAQAFEAFLKEREGK